MFVDFQRKLYNLSRPRNPASPRLAGRRRTSRPSALSHPILSSSFMSAKWGESARPLPGISLSREPKGPYVRFNSWKASFCFGVTLSSGGTLRGDTRFPPRSFFPEPFLRLQPSMSGLSATGQVLGRTGFPQGQEVSLTSPPFYMRRRQVHLIHTGPLRPERCGHPPGFDTRCFPTIDLHSHDYLTVPSMVPPGPVSALPHAQERPCGTSAPSPWLTPQG